jgi:hypothetical protein
MTACRVSNDDAVRGGKRLQARRKVGCLADNRLFLGGAGADQIADDGKRI